MHRFTPHHSESPIQSDLGQMTPEEPTYLAQGGSLETNPGRDAATSPIGIVVSGLQSANCSLQIAKCFRLGKSPVSPTCNCQFAMSILQFAIAPYRRNSWGQLFYSDWHQKMPDCSRGCEISFSAKAFDTTRFVTKCLPKDRDHCSRNRAVNAPLSAHTKFPVDGFLFSNSIWFAAFHRDLWTGRWL